MATLESFFATDQEAEVGGTWVDIGPFKFKLARAGGSNERFERVNAAAWKPYLRDLELGTLPKQKEREIVAGAYAEAVVMDWQGVDADDGQPLPCTRENVAAKLAAMPELLERVITAARRFETFRSAQRETAAKNS